MANKKIVLIVALSLVILVTAYFILKSKKFSLGESSFSKGEELPDISTLEYMAEMQHVFPFKIEKVTPGVIQLPDILFLTKRNSEYKTFDVNQGDTVKVVRRVLLRYVSGSEAYIDNFLITDKDYIISYTQAQRHFVTA